MTIYKKTGLFLMVIIGSLIAFGFNSGCRRNEPKKATLSELLAKSNFVVFANGHWRSDLELEVIANDSLAIRRDQQLEAAPPPGKVIDVIKFSEHPSSSPESFVIFYRLVNSASEIVALATVNAGRFTSIIDDTGRDGNVSDFRKQLSGK